MFLGFAGQLRQAVAQRRMTPSANCVEGVNKEELLAKQASFEGRLFASSKNRGQCFAFLRGKDTHTAATGR